MPGWQWKFKWNIKGSRNSHIWYWTYIWTLLHSKRTLHSKINDNWYTYTHTHCRNILVSRLVAELNGFSCHCFWCGYSLVSLEIVQWARNWTAFQTVSISKWRSVCVCVWLGRLNVCHRVKWNERPSTYEYACVQSRWHQAVLSDMRLLWMPLIIATAVKCVQSVAFILFSNGFAYFEADAIMQSQLITRHFKTHFDM